jgi:hypothetical protein
MVFQFVPVEELALLATHPSLRRGRIFEPEDIWERCFVKGQIAAISVAIGTAGAGIIDYR